MDVTEIENEIAKLNDRVGFLKAVAAVLQREPTSLNEEIFQKYVECRSTPKTARYLREKGIKTKRNTSFQPGDVSEIVQNQPEDSDPVLVEMAYEIFTRNRNAVARQYW